MYAIIFNPDLLESLKNIQLPIKSINDLTGRSTASVAVFSDYGPNNTPFQTFGFYITDWNISGELTRILYDIKAKHRSSGRTIDYKGRKDKLKRRGFREWIKAVRCWPGLLYIFAVDRRLEGLAPFRAEQAKRKKEFKEDGLNDYDIYSRMFGALSFLPMLSPYLNKQHKIFWITDKDCIIDTPKRRDTLIRTFGYHAELLLNKSLSDIAVTALTDDDDSEAGIFNRHARELVSVADVAASALAASLSIDENNQPKMFCPDPEAIDMIQEISKFQSVANYKVEDRLSCPLLISLFLLDYTDDGRPFYKHDTATLTYDHEKDPLQGMSWAPEGSDIHLEVFRRGFSKRIKI